jgi:hypothetical protein
MASLSEFMPQCRWVIVDASKGNAPFAAANDRESIVRLMQKVPEAEREHHGSSTGWRRIGRRSTSRPIGARPTDGTPDTFPACGENMARWNAIGGVAALALGLLLFSIGAPAPLWWAPWASCIGGGLLLASAGLSTFLDRRQGQ